MLDQPPRNLSKSAIAPDTSDWNFFWYGIDDFTQVAQCFDNALNQPVTLEATE